MDNNLAHMLQAFCVFQIEYVQYVSPIRPVAVSWLDWTWEDLVFSFCYNHVGQERISVEEGNWEWKRKATVWLLLK